MQKMIESINLRFRYPLLELDPNKVKYIIIHHPGAIKATIQDIHRWHLGNGWSGIGYNEYITKSGKVYIGRGDKVGAHCADSVTNYNPISYGICTEGDYNLEKTMPEQQFHALIERIKVAQAKFKNAIVVPHKQLTATSCPGKYFPWGRMITELTLPILKLRSTGDAVKVLQRKLIQHGYFIGFVDGIFGLLTRRAVVKFQRKNGLLADAIVGPITWSKLNSK
jgi:hypothetical protein